MRHNPTLVLFPLTSGAAALAFLVGQTLQGIVKTTLYLYATEGLKPGEFDNVDFDGFAEETDNTTQQPTATPGRI